MAVRRCTVGERTEIVFFLGIIVGAIVTAVAALVVFDRQRRRLAGLERQAEAQSRRISELDEQVAAERASGAAAVRDAKLMTEREFEQYKILLKRADRALADARAARDRLGRVAA